MLFENNSNTIPIRFLRCKYFKQSKIHHVMEKRKYCAIGLRISSDAVVEWGNKRVQLTDKTITFKPQNVGYTRWCNKDEFIAINFETYNYVYNDIVAFEPTDYNKFYTLFQQLMDCYDAKQKGYMYKCTALLSEIMALMQIDFVEEREKVSPLITEACEYMHSHYFENDCTVEKLAKMSNVSAVYFRKLFKEKFGIGPKKYLNTLRMEHAARLLAQTHLSVSQVAEQSGFNDSKHFASMFKEIYKTTPTKFRSEDSLHDIVIRL